MNAAQNEAERKALRHIPARDTRRHPLASECQKKTWPGVFPAPGMLLKERKLECAFFCLIMIPNKSCENFQTNWSLGR
jgi:hypothetical protein